VPATPTVRVRAPAPAVPDARPVRLKRGKEPSHSSLTGFERWAWRTFGARATARPPDPTLEENIAKAHMRVRADEYVAKVYATVVVAEIAAVVAAAVLLFLFFTSGSAAFVLGPHGLSVHIAPLGIIELAAGILLPVLAPLAAYGVLMGTPASKAKDRGRKIDKKMSAAMSFVSAMSSADVNVDQIFRELGRQKIYGEVAEEAAWITRDTELLGVDILTAIKDGAQRTPSKRFQDFLQGVVTTATSGGQLKPYFLLKAEQYERENKLDLLRRVESMGLLAEIFVTTIVAFPLFLVIMLSIFAVVGNYGAAVLTFLWAIIGLMIPIGEFGFIVIMYISANEGK
jgi:archaeal flagellar protein FlaJ